MIIRMNGYELAQKITNVAVSIQEEAPQKKKLSDGTQHTLAWAALCSMVPWTAAPTPALALPVMATTTTKGMIIAAAATAVNTSGFFKLLEAIIAIMDPVATCVVVFAGAAWMFGHRTKSIDLLIGVAAGSLIITHAHDLVYWLQHVM